MTSDHDLCESDQILTVDGTMERRQATVLKGNT